MTIKTDLRLVPIPTSILHRSYCENRGDDNIHEVVKTVDQELKLRMKDLLLTASHSLRSSPTGRRTASRRLPLPRVASMCLFSCIPCKQSQTFRFRTEHEDRRTAFTIITTGVYVYQENSMTQLSSREACCYFFFHDWHPEFCPPKYKILRFASWLQFSPCKQPVCRVLALQESKLNIMQLCSHELN